MAEKKKWAPTKMFLQWCLSYLLISVIALTLLLASGYRYLDVLRDNLEYTNGIQLDMTRVWLDQKVKLLRNITAKESSTAAIEAVRQADDYDDIPRYDYYMLTRKISTDVINYGIGDAYFLYFPSTDAIVSNTKYGQSRRFYDLVLEAYDISYEDWMEILKQNLVTTRVFQPVVQGKDSKNYLVLMRPLNITSREPDKAVAVMIVDLEDLFKASDWLNNDTLCINDRNNGVLVANHELPEATENAVTELIKSSGSRKFDEAAHRTSKEEYISIISSTYENWDIAVILKEQAFASKIIDIQKLLAVVVIIYLLLTVAVIANEDDAEPRCQMVVSAERPEGPYGEPAWIHEDGIDPSILHDDDGRHYMLFNRSVRMAELTPDCRAMRGPARLIWGGDLKRKTEGPQLMKHDGYYYLLAAEGGTGAGHRISAARSKNVWGPYENCPYNPILRQDDEGGYLQNCGHGKLLQTADGRWFLCFLCLRRDPDGTAPMGRETSIAEVTWTPDGWPVAAYGRRPRAVLNMPFSEEIPTLTPVGISRPWRARTRRPKAHPPSIRPAAMSTRLSAAARSSGSRQSPLWRRDDPPRRSCC